MNKENNGFSRRAFIKKTGIAAAAITIVPRHVLGGNGYTSPSDKLNIVGIGIGGKGYDNLIAMETENIIGLADVDWQYADHVFKHYPKAKKYKDYRKMFDELGKSIDGVMIATPDHTHAISASEAMTLGKHVYVQKPLTHTIYESRLLTKLAEKHKVVTQMGNQGASSDDSSKTIEWLQNNEIGEIRKIEAFTDRPIWPQGLDIPDPENIPDTLDWDLFIGPAKYRQYNHAYTPWNWRGWWDFGTGALGDMACHVLHPAFIALELGSPAKMQGSSTLLLTDSAPNAEMVKLIFPKRKASNGNKMKLPEVEMNWFDGGLRQFMPEGWPAGKPMGFNGGGTVFYGSKDTLVCGTFGTAPMLLSGREPKVSQKRRRITISHEQDWIRACKESPENRIDPASPFKEAGPFNEMVVMGVLAVRLQALNKILEYDSKKMEITNIDDNETISTVIKDGFTIHNGHPSFNKDWSEPVNANEFAAELIKHKYRDGWKLPDMPV